MILQHLSAGALADELRDVLGKGAALPDVLVGQWVAGRAFAALDRLREGLRAVHPGERFHRVLEDGRGTGAMPSRELTGAAQVSDHLVVFLLEVEQGTCPVTDERVNETHLASCPHHRALVDGLIRSFVAALDSDREGMDFIRPYRDALVELRIAAEEADEDAPPFFDLRCRAADGSERIISVPVATEYQVSRIQTDVERFGRDAELVGTYAESLISFAGFIGVERLDDVQFNMARKLFYAARGIPKDGGRNGQGG